MAEIEEKDEAGKAIVSFDHFEFDEILKILKFLRFSIPKYFQNEIFRNQNKKCSS